MYMNPELEAFIEKMLEGMASLPPPPVPPSLEQRRAFIDEIVRPLCPPPRAVHEHREMSIPGPSGDIRTLVVTPRDADEGLPLLVWYHGGGTVMMSPETELPAITAAAVEADCIVIAPAYGLAPENPFPGPLEDAYATLLWTQEHASELGGDPARVAVAGASGGGYLAAGVCLEAKRLGSPQPIHQFLTVPMIDQAGRSRSWVLYDWFTGPLGPMAADLEEKGYLYPLAFGESRRDPRATLVLGDDHSDLPPAMIITCELDPLHDEGVAYVAKLRQAGVHVMHLDYDGATHAFPFMGAIADHSNMLLAQLFGTMSYVFNRDRWLSS